jgi:hypothetical protein
VVENCGSCVSRAGFLTRDPWDNRKQRTNKVAVLEVVAVQLVARLLCIENVLVNDKGSALGVVGNALTDLTAAVGEHRLQISSTAGRCDIPDRSVFAEEVEQLLRRYVIAKDEVRR